MSLARLRAVFAQDLAHQARRPLVWILLAVLLFTAYGLSAGTVHIESGSSEVGGLKAWLTSEFAFAQVISVLVPVFYGFFLAVAAGMSVIQDDELEVGAILHATPLRPAEYVWGRYFSVLTAFFAILAAHMCAAVVCNHLLPNAHTAEIIGPFQPLNYLRPALVFAVPSLVFIAAASFVVGERTRRPILVFLLPVALLLACMFFLWEWNPSWLDPRIDRALMLLDPTGFRWLNGTWLVVDRGVRFYNTTPIDYDAPFLFSRLVVLALSLGAVDLSRRRFEGTLRGTARARRGRRAPRAASPVAGEAASSRPGLPVAPPDLGTLEMRVTGSGALRTTLEVAKLELRGLFGQAGLYLYTPLILIQTVVTALFAVGPFDTPLLATSGLLAGGGRNTLSLLVCLLLMFYTVESLERERRTGLEPLLHATPVRSAALLAGKALANSMVAVMILAVALLTSIVVALANGLPVDLRPFLVMWGLLLVPTFVVWTAFVMAVMSLARSRYAAYGICLGAFALTAYGMKLGKITWATNWLLWGAVGWSDMSVLELDREAILLNRLGMLALAVLFVALAVRFHPRQEQDLPRLMHRLRPASLLRGALRLALFAVAPIGLLVALQLEVERGYQGDAAKQRARDYWLKNVATWKGAPLPTITGVTLDLEIDPDRHSLHMKGEYRLANVREEAMATVPLTIGDHWGPVAWTMNGAAYTPEDRAGLCVFTSPAPLQPGEGIRIGFEYDATLPRGISRNGRGAHSAREFILPSGAVLNGLGYGFMPLVGYDTEYEERALKEEERPEPRVYPDDFYHGLTHAAFGSETPFSATVRVTAPADLTVNSVGVLESETVKDGRRTVVWKTDYPVSMVNVVAGRWAVRKGEGTSIFYHPGHTYNIEAMGTALDAARRYYSEWFRPYPWKELKLSEFPSLAGYAMGFATNINFSEGLGFLADPDPRADAPFLVTAHEAAHQWWGNLIVPGEGPGGDVLDEGTAHFSAILLMEQVKGQRARIELCRRIEAHYARERRLDGERPLVKIDDSRTGDDTVKYDRGGWALWMMHRLLGREASLRGYQAFFRRYDGNPDHPVLQDLLEHMRDYAPDPVAYDELVKQWFFDVVLPEYRLSDAKLEPEGPGWRLTVTVQNVGTGRMPVEVAAVRGERFADGAAGGSGKSAAEGGPDVYQEQRGVVSPGAGETRTVTLTCPFRPERVVIDPDAGVMQLNRKAAVLSVGASEQAAGPAPSPRPRG